MKSRKKNVSRKVSFLWVLLVVVLAAVLATPASVAAQSGTQVSAWIAEYYSNRYLSGSPALVRDDGAINFDWGSGAPAAGLPSDGFSARWTRSLYFSAGAYRFFALSDDGVRVWLDNELIIDQWHPSPGNIYAADGSLGSGTHLIRVEYYEEGGGARMQFWWEPLGSHYYPDWKGEYYASGSPSGSPVLVRNDADIDFNWGSGSPVADVPVDNFSVRWTRQAFFEEATYRFHAIVDGGVCLWVGGKMVIDAWNDGSIREFTADYDLARGDYGLKVEFFEGRGDARIEVWWEKVGPSFPDWKGEYWTNAYLSGNPALVQNEGRIDFNWGLGSAAAGLPVDNWSARWTRTLYFEAGTYRFAITVDDGARLWIDNALVIDAWYEGTRQMSTDSTLGAGYHTVRVEFCERGGEAQMRLRWDKVPPRAQPTWNGRYYANMSLDGNPNLVREDAAIDFNWGGGAAAAGLPADKFSIRWERWVSFDYATYTFFARADNGIRVYVDGVPLIDEWYSNGIDVFAVSKTLDGVHHLVVEYYENGGPAQVAFWWER